MFPDLSNGLEERLTEFVEGGDTKDLEFVLGILSAFEGKPCIYEHVRAIVATLSPESPLLRDAQFALGQIGMVSGAFGFAKLYTERKALLEAWLADQNETVKAFAKDYITELDRLIAAETRSAEASIAMRKLDYDEELDGGEEE